ncbi:hypothetical protein D621_00295 [beta proteobacterium AAP51]|nr:hypothetical protein D621_00295 [beta proteobacterium AAP51]
MPRTKDGTVRRTWVHRFKVTVVNPDGTKSHKSDRTDLGLATEVEKGDQVMSLDDAKAAVLAARRAASHVREDGVKSERLTLEKAWSYYDVEKPHHRADTRTKDTRNFEHYLGHLRSRYLDELDYAFWAKYTHDLRLGKLLVGKKANEAGVEVPVFRGPVAADTLVGVLNTASMLYEIGHKYRGLEGIPKTENPARDAKKLTGPKVERRGRIPLSKLGRAWRASDQMMAPWWRDQFRLYVLTGLRRSLMVNLQFSEVDFESGKLVISPHKRGTKRRGAKTPADAPPLRVPLSKLSLSILKERREFAPDPAGPVWYSPKPTRGKARKDAVLSDPRAAWTTVEDVLDLHFTPSDLRRTFATIGAAAAGDVFGVALLMLHSAKGLAETVNIPGITVQYMETDEAQERMQKAAEEVCAKVMQVAAMPSETASQLEEANLPAILEQVLRATSED